MPGTHQPARPHTTSIFPPVTKPSLTPLLSIQRTTSVTGKHKAKYKDEHNNNVNDKAFKITSVCSVKRVSSLNSLSSYSSVSNLRGGSNVSSVSSASSVNSEICRQLVYCCTTEYCLGRSTPAVQVMICKVIPKIKIINRPFVSNFLYKRLCN